jgi:hypothetical protein
MPKGLWRAHFLPRYNASMSAAPTTAAASMAENAPVKPRRRWYQFSLRTLMIAMVVIATTLGLGMSWYRRAQCQAEAVVTLRGLENGCLYDDEYRLDEFGQLEILYPCEPEDATLWKQVSRSFFHRIGAVWLRTEWDGDPHDFPLVQRPPSHAEIQETQRRRESIWKAVLTLSGIEYLSVNGEIPSNGLESLRRFPRLRTLIIGKAAGSKSLDPIGELRSLEYLELDTNSKVLTVRAVKAIGRLPHLHFLGLPSSRLEAGHLRALAEGSQIESLNLESADMTSEGIEALRGLSTLKRLSLRGTAVNDSWGPALEQLSSLEELDLSQTNAGPAIMESLAKLPNLRQLNTSQTNITGRSIVKFLQQHPHCRFVWGEDRYP